MPFVDHRLFFPATARNQDAIAAVDVWNHEVNGYYRSVSGRVVTQWPFSMTDFKTMTEKIDPDAFEVG